MSKPKQGIKRLSLFWRFQTQSEQKYAPLVEYLNATEDLPYHRTEMFLQALSAFWNPFALSWIGRSKQEVKTAALFAIKALELQIALLENQFDIVSQKKILTRKKTNGHKLVNDSEPEVDLRYEDLDVNDEADILNEWMNN